MKSLLPRTPRLCLFRLFADTALALSLLGLVGVYILWSMCQRPGGVEWDLGSENSDSRLVICSRDSRLILGLYSPSHTRGWGRWSRYGQNSVNQLLDDDDVHVAGDLLGWGVAAPHWVFALFLCSVPAWWILVRMTRREERIRVEEGLCRSCGYDIRASDGRCPECGEPLPPLALRRPTTTTKPS